MRVAALVLALLLTGCTTGREPWREQYLAAHERWEIGYHSADVSVAFDATKVFTDFLKKMEQDQVPFERTEGVLAWSYARLGMLAEYQGKEREAEVYFAEAVKYAKKDFPAMSTAEKFRSTLQEMDKPETHPWMKKKPNKSAQTRSLARPV